MRCKTRVDASRRERPLICILKCQKSRRTPLICFSKRNQIYQMEDTSNRDLTQVKDEPSACKKEPVSRCDDLVNEFVDYTMVSVPLSATDIAEMDSTAFMDSISQSTSKQVAESKQTVTPPAESMEVDENTDLPDTSPIEDNSEPTASEPTIPKTCDISTASAIEDPPSSHTEERKDSNVKDDDVVMLLSDSEDEDEDKNKTDAPVSDAQMVEKISNKEAISDVADATLTDDKAPTETNSADIVKAVNNDNDSSVIMLDDSPENSEAEAQNNDDSSKANSTGNKGE